MQGKKKSEKEKTSHSNPSVRHEKSFSGFTQSKQTYQWKQKGGQSNPRSEFNSENRYAFLNMQKTGLEEVTGENSEAPTGHRKILETRQNSEENFPMTDTCQESEEEKDMLFDKLNNNIYPCTQETDFGTSEKEDLFSTNKSYFSSKKKKNKSETHQILEDLCVGNGDATVALIYVEKSYPNTETVYISPSVKQKNPNPNNPRTHTKNGVSAEHNTLTPVS